jgi:ribosomal protein S6
MEKTETRENTRVYEIGYHIVSSIPEEKIPAEVDAIKAVIAKAGGEFISEEFPKLRQLAFTMVKKVGSQSARYNDAYFGWVKFDIVPEALQAIKATLDASDHILRYILIGTVRENTYIGQKLAPKAKAEEEAKGGEETLPAAEVVAEEIDKTIDDMVKEA